MEVSGGGVVAGGRDEGVYFFYYYPIGVDVPRPRVAWATLALLSGIVAVHLCVGPLARYVDFDWYLYVYRPAEMSWLTPLTAVFLHGGWIHLAGNALYLWVFGPPLERALGRIGFLLLFVGTGYLGNLTHGALVTNLEPAAVWGGVVGASGAISGLLGLFLLRYPYGRVRIAWWTFLPLQGVNRAGVAETPAVAALLLWVLMQVAMMLVKGAAGGTAYGAHLGGLATGLVLALALAMPWRAANERWLMAGRRHLRRGEALAAVGAFERYLEAVAHDDEARLELARARRVAGQVAEAARTYRRVARTALREDRLAEACDVYSEARRGDSSFHLDTAEQRRVAHFLEKLGRDREAVTAYLDLYRFDRDHPDALHALARAGTLMITRLRRGEEGLELFERALDEFPDHPMQGWLEREYQALRADRRGFAA